MKSHSTHEKSSNSDIENDEYQSNRIKEDAKNNYIDNEFRENVKKYIYIDDTIRSRQEEIKELKNVKKPCENFIINYLEKVEQEYVLLGESKIVKNEYKQKSPIKIDLIKEVIKEESKNEKLFDSEEKYNKFIDGILELMERKRVVKKKVSLRRIIPKNRKK